MQHSGQKAVGIYEPVPKWNDLIQVYKSEEHSGINPPNSHKISQKIKIIKILPSDAKFNVDFKSVTKFVLSLMASKI